MAAPDYVPVVLAEQPRRSLALPPPRRWVADRPGEVVDGQPHGPLLGNPGPDQGYALALADRFTNRLVLTPGEHPYDAIAGCVAVALHRASISGRAPMGEDLDFAFRLWGFLGDAPEDLVAYRRPLFAGASHHYWDQRAITDVVPQATMRAKPGEISPRNWHSLLGV